jgi:hypothetical protein
MSEARSADSGSSQILESKKYHFTADGTMPVLDFAIKSGKVGEDEEHLILEIYHPMSGEIFEAKFQKGRIEVDRDGSITYFTTTQDHARFSIFLQRNLAITVDRSGAVEIKSPSKILSVHKEKRKKADPANVDSGKVVLQLE